MNGRSALCRLFTAGLLGIAGLWVMAPPARAAKPSSDEIAVAKKQFRLGVKAAEEGRWEDAYKALRKAYDTAPKVAILLNLGGAEVQTGRVVEAAESYRTFLEKATDTRFEPHLEAVAKLLSELEQRVPSVEIQVLNLHAADVLKLDQKVIARDTLGAPLAVNPGNHILSLERGGSEVGRIWFSVAEGDFQKLSLKARPYAAAPPKTGAPSSRPQPSSQE